MPTKNIVIIYTGDDWGEAHPKTGSETTTKALAEWGIFGLKKKINIYRAEIHWYDEAAQVFTKAWVASGGAWQKVTRTIVPNLIFDKTAGVKEHELAALKMSLAQKFRMVNHPLFRSLLSSKAAQYLCLGEFMPRSFIASNIRELKEGLSQIKSGQGVVKPLHGSGGFGIIIGTPLDILKQEINYPVLVQEFKEGTKGIPGFSTKPRLADLRLIFSNYQLIYALSRRAKGKSLFTNIHQGATAERVPLETIPAAAIKISRIINSRLSFFPYSLYTLDFIFDDAGRPWLIELNTSPGIDIIYITADLSAREKFFQDCMLSNLI